MHSRAPNHTVRFYINRRVSLQVCVQERNIFCSEVSTGSARVFRCLAHNLAKADFGSACRNEIKAKLLRRQQNWKLDVSLRNGCKDDVAALCADVDHDADKADVARCLISYHANLTDTCAHEARPTALFLATVQPGTFHVKTVQHIPPTPFYCSTSSSPPACRRLGR